MPPGKKSATFVRYCRSSRDLLNRKEGAFLAALHFKAARNSISLNSSEKRSTVEQATEQVSHDFAEHTSPASSTDHSEHGLALSTLCPHHKNNFGCTGFVNVLSTCATYHFGHRLVSSTLCSHFYHISFRAYTALINVLAPILQ